MSGLWFGTTTGHKGKKKGPRGKGTAKTETAGGVQLVKSGGGGKKDPNKQGKPQERKAESKPKVKARLRKFPLRLGGKVCNTFYCRHNHDDGKARGGIAAEVWRGS